MKNPNDVKQAQEIKNQAVDKIINEFAQELNLYEVDKTRPVSYTHLTLPTPPYE